MGKVVEQHDVVIVGAGHADVRRHLPRRDLEWTLSFLLLVSIVLL